LAKIKAKMEEGVLRITPNEPNEEKPSAEAAD
jgi:hypothetical protein